MIRHRSRSLPFVCSGNPNLPLIGKVPVSDSATVHYGYSEVESMDDDITYPHLRGVKALVHESSVASFVDDSTTFLADYGLPHSVYADLCYNSHYDTLAMGIPTATLTPFSDVPWDSLMSSFVKVVRDGIQTKSLLMVSLWELRQTVEMVRNPFNLLKINWRDIAHNHSAQSLSKRSANLWLEGRYGWQAAYFDLKTYCSSYKKWFTKVRSASDQGDLGARLVQRQTYSGTAPYASSESDDTVSQWLQMRENSSADFYGKSVVKTDSASCVASIFARRGMPHIGLYNMFDYAMQSLGCTTSDILPTLWEILPYSFVVDWFINVNAILCRPDYGYLTSEHLIDYGYSIKNIWKYKVKYIPFHPLSYDYRRFWNTWQEPKYGSIGWKSLYQRTVGWPASESLFVSGSGLNLIKSVDSVMLSLQKLLTNHR